jgi:hypothetical protein
LTDNYVDVFSCNRSGHPKISVRERKRQLKAHGYIKCGNICISHLRLTHFFRSKKSKTYHLSYLKTHSGHSLEANAEDTTKSNVLVADYSRLSSDQSIDESHSKSISSIESLPNAQLNDDTNLSGTTIDCEADQLLTSFSDKSSSVVVSSSASSLSLHSSSSNLTTAPLTDSSFTVPMSDTRLFVNSPPRPVNHLSSGNMAPVLNPSPQTVHFPTASSLNSSLANAFFCGKLDDLAPFNDSHSTNSDVASSCISSSTEVLSFHNYAAKPPVVCSSPPIEPSDHKTDESVSIAVQQRASDCSPTDSASYVLVLQTDGSNPITLGTIRSPGSTVSNPQSTPSTTSKAAPIVLHATNASSNASTSTAIKSNGQVFVNGSSGNSNQSPLQRQSEIVRQRVQQRVQKIMSSSLLLHQLNELDQFLTAYTDKHCSR